MSDESPVPDILPPPSLMPPSVGSHRLQSFLSQPDALRVICRHIANGGCLIELAKLWSVSYCDITEWLHQVPARYKSYRDAVQDRSDWAIESVLFEVRQIGQADLRDAFDKEGKVMPPHEWPDKLAACVSSVDAREEYDKEGAHTGTTYKIKLWDKLKANELRGRNLAMFVDKIKHEVSATLEDLILASHKKENDHEEKETSEEADETQG